MDRTAYSALLAQYATPEVSGNGRVSWEGGVKCVMPSVKLYGKCEQDGTPTPDVPVPARCNNGTFAVRGSNLAEIPDLISQSYSVSVRSYIQWYIDLPVGATVTVSADAYTPYDEGGHISAWRIVLKDNTLITLWAGYTNAEQRVFYTHTKTVDFTISDVSYALWYLGAGVGEYDRWAKNITVNIGNADLGFAPCYDGGTVQAPELLAAVDGTCQSIYEPQTGRITDWWWPEIVLDGSEAWSPYKSGDWVGFFLGNALPETMYRNRCWSNQFLPVPKLWTQKLYPNIWCGVYDKALYVVGYSGDPPPSFDDTLADKGLANWKAHLAEYPLHIWAARNEPLVTYTAPARLTMPSGPGQIIQTGGDVAECPITARYLTHS